ncbi:MAG TPA: FtsW/RodA/SpoVE family cell cycle protein, partial [Anaerolineaceae bacterium]|nr:FtsW/RodA/SpoVE family cell cycle protein [Anaerolineaceae bacterium]
MGTPTSVNFSNDRETQNLAGRSGTPDATIPAIRQPHTLRYGLDIPLLLSVVTLLVIGLLMVFSASWKYAVQEKEPVTFILFSQLIWVVIGGAAALAASFFDYHRYRRLAVPIMIATIGMLLLVQILQDERNGAVRSLFGGSVRPSELAKLAIIIYLAFWLYSKREVLNKITFGLIPMMMIIGILGGLILMQPDLSAVVTIFILGGLMFFIAKGELRQIVMVIAIAAVVGYLLVTLFPSGQARLGEYMDGLQDPSKASYHIRRSIGAVVDGGLFGVGIGNAESKYTGLPFAWTDSIFAIIVEELGLVGATGIVGLYLVFMWRGLKIASEAPDMLGRLLAGGLTLWIVIEALINMSVMLNLMPSAGNALPLI